MTSTPILGFAAELQQLLLLALEQPRTLFGLDLVGSRRGLQTCPQAGLERLHDSRVESS